MPPSFRRTADRLFGEGIGCSRAPLVQLEYALSSLRFIRRLHHSDVGVLFYQDEGHDCRYSREIIEEACSQAREVLILRPGSVPKNVVTQHRGQYKLRLLIQGHPRRLGQAGTRQEVTRWTMKKLEQICALSSRQDRLAIGVVDINMDHYPMLLPHQNKVDLNLSYYDKLIADQAVAAIKGILGKKGYKWVVEKISDRPPMVERRKSLTMYKHLKEVADHWEIPLDKTSSLWPSVGGLVTKKVGVLCGMAPVTQDMYTPNESISRLTLLRRTLLLALYLEKYGSSNNSNSTS